MNNALITGFKLTDSRGAAFFSKRDQHRLETGKQIVAEDYDPNPTVGHGLHFSGTIEDVVVDGTNAALSFDYKHGDQRSALYSTDNVSNQSPSRLLEDGVKVFKVVTDQAVHIPNTTKFKAQNLTAVEEVPLHSFAKQFVKSGNFMGLALVAGCSPPGIVQSLMASLPEMEGGNHTAVSDALNTGWMLNKQNPEHLKVGNKVLLMDGDHQVEGTMVGYGREKLGDIAVMVDGKRREVTASSVQQTGGFDQQVSDKYYDDPRLARMSTQGSPLDKLVALSARSTSDLTLGTRNQTAKGQTTMATQRTPDEWILR